MGLAFSPLLGVHGVESALALGLVLPTLAAWTGAQLQRSTDAQRGFDLMMRAVARALIIWAIPVGVLALNALRVRQCAPLEGLGFMVLGPGIGCVLGAVTGVWVAALMRGSRWSPWIAATIPIVGLLVGLWAFYATPTVFVLGAFAGYFPGAIYDDLVPIPTRYLTYRACTLLAISGLVLLFDAVWDRESERASFRRALRYHPGTTSVGLAILAPVAIGYLFGNQLGHSISTEFLATHLGKRETGQACVVVMPRETPSDVGRRLVEDCDFQVIRSRSVLGLESSDHVTAYFFRNRDEKKNLIGVGRTLIAKPWRNEIYLQMDRWPHPVLGHEVAHAVLKDSGRGPFAVSGSLGGLIPNPGIVEGAAVALAWDLRDDLDPDQWSRILLDRGELPTASELLSLQFTALPPIRAYMPAGSLVAFAMARGGPEALLHAYETGAFEDLDELETAWHQNLEQVDVTDHERGVAEVALARPSVFGAVCPHRLAQLRADLGGDLAARDDDRTIETCREILDIDANEAQAHASLVGALARSGDDVQARSELEGLRATMAAPKPIVAAALEQYADAQWTQGDLVEAEALYDELLEIPRTDTPARQSEVKRLALQGSPEERALVYEMMIERGSSTVAVHVARELGTLREDGLGPYLESRQLMAEGRYALAIPLLEEAKSRGLPTLRLRHELDRMMGVGYFAVGRYQDSSQAWETRRPIGAAPNAEAERWQQRIEFATTGQVSSSDPVPSSAHQAVP